MRSSLQDSKDQLLEITSPLPEASLHVPNAQGCPAPLRHQLISCSFRVYYLNVHTNQYDEVVFDLLSATGHLRFTLIHKISSSLTAVSASL